MTEVEWLGCTHPKPMLEFLKGQVSDRKFRLFGVASCRRIWMLLNDERSKHAVDYSEKHADGEISREQLNSAVNNAIEAAQTGGPPADAREAACFEMIVCEFGLAEAVAAGADAAAHATARTSMIEGKGYGYDSAQVCEERRKQCELLRDIMPNPFRPVTVVLACLTPKVKTLAKPSTITVPSSGCRNWPTPLRQRAVATRTS